MDEEHQEDQETIQHYIQRQFAEIQARQRQEEQRRREQEHVLNREEEVERVVTEMEEQYTIHPGEHPGNDNRPVAMDTISTLTSNPHVFVRNSHENNWNRMSSVQSNMPASWDTSPEQPEEGQIRVGGIEYETFYIVYHHELGIDIEKYDFRNVYRLKKDSLTHAVEDSVRQHINKRNSLAFETCALPNKGRRIFLMASAIVRYEILEEEAYKQRFEMRAAPSTTSVSKNTLE